MKRRQFIQGASLGAVAAAASFPTPSIAQGVKELRMVTSWPKGYPGQGTAAIRFAERVAQATDGKLTVKVFDSFIAFRRNVMEWTRLSEQAFTGARGLGFKYG